MAASLNVNGARTVLIVLSLLSSIIHVHATSCVFDVNNHPAGCTIVTNDIDASIIAVADRLESVEVVMGNIDLNSFTNFTVMTNLRRVEGNIRFTTGNLESVEFPLLENVTGDITLSDCSTLQSIEMPNLRLVHAITFTNLLTSGIYFPLNFLSLEFANQIDFNSVHVISELNFPSLKSVGVHAMFWTMNNLASVNFHSLNGSANYLSLVYIPALQALSLPTATHFNRLDIARGPLYNVSLPELVEASQINLGLLPSLNTTYMPKLKKSSIDVNGCATQSPMVMDLPQLMESLELDIDGSKVTPILATGLRITGMLTLSGFLGNLTIPGVVYAAAIRVLSSPLTTGVSAPDLEEVGTINLLSIGASTTTEFVLDLPKLRRISSTNTVWFKNIKNWKSAVFPSLETMMSDSFGFQNTPNLQEVSLPKLINISILQFAVCGTTATAPLVLDTPMLESLSNVIIYNAANAKNFTITAKRVDSVSIQASANLENLTITSKQEQTLQLLSLQTLAKLKHINLPGLKRAKQMQFVGLATGYTDDTMTMNFDNLLSVETLQIQNVRNLRQINAPNLENVTTLLRLENVNDFRTLGGLEGLRHVTSFNLTNVFDLCKNETIALADTLGVTLDGTTYVVINANGSCDFCGDGFHNYQEPCDVSAGDIVCTTLCEPAPTGLGADCSLWGDAGCDSLHCVDGMCCDAACDGLCQHCSSSGHCITETKRCNHDKETQSNTGKSKSRAASKIVFLGMNTASTAGAAVGTLLFLVIVVAALVIMAHRRRQQVTKLYHGEKAVDYVKPQMTDLDNATLRMSSSDVVTDISGGATSLRAGVSGTATVPLDIHALTENIASMHADLHDTA